MKAASSKALDVIRLVVQADTPAGSWQRRPGRLRLPEGPRAPARGLDAPQQARNLLPAHREDDKAREQYEEAVRLDPNYATAWNNLATVHHTQGKHAKAVSLYRKAIDKTTRLRGRLAQSRRRRARPRQRRAGSVSLS